MQIVMGLLMAALSGFLIWRMAQTLRQNPSLLSKANVSQSMRTLGQLALLLIAFVGFLVLLLRF